ncbi:MAG: flagellar hook-length control protein FliK [Ectothiorhodospiraceae bacterium]|nr:flagellar hook-length control protein FliK [Ectothiorhodospiraceae bacterium]
MQGLNMLQSFLGGLGGDSLDVRTLKDPENRAFLEALLDSDAFRDMDVSMEDLEAGLAGEGGKYLPLETEDLPHFAMDMPVGLSEADDEGHAHEAVLALLQDAVGTELQTKGKEPGQQLAARLALLEQVQLRQQLQAQAASPESVDVDDMPLPVRSESVAVLQSYAQTAQMLDGTQRAGVPSYTVHTGMDRPGWGQAVGERLMVMANQGVQQARIQLNPRELGPLEVNISMKDDKTSVVFTAQHAVTREALESEIPRLRLMMQENGHGEVDVDVARDQQQQARDDDRERDNWGQQSAEQDEEQAQSQPLEPRGLVDHYA